MSDKTNLAYGQTVQRGSENGTKSYIITVLCDRQTDKTWSKANQHVHFDEQVLKPVTVLCTEFI